MSPRRARPLIEGLAADGVVEPVAVEGWKEPAYLDPDARCPRRIGATALLSPFDPVVWFRPRAERLFDFHYRIEIYVPREKRRWGYYVLPFLMGEKIVGRLDLKADRPGATLRVEAAHVEAHAEPQEVAESMARELAQVASWLSLDAVSVGRRGGLARALAGAVRNDEACRSLGS